MREKVFSRVKCFRLDVTQTSKTAMTNNTTVSLRWHLSVAYVIDDWKCSKEEKFFLFIPIHYNINVCIGWNSLAFDMLFAMNEPHLGLNWFQCFFSLWHFNDFRFVYGVKMEQIGFYFSWAMLDECVCLIVLWMINYYVRSLIDKHLSFGTESISFVDGGNVETKHTRNKLKKKASFPYSTTHMIPKNGNRAHTHNQKKKKTNDSLCCECSIKIADIHCFYGKSRKLNDNNLLIIYKTIFFGGISVDTIVCWISLGRLSALSKNTKYTARLPKSSFTWQE